MWWKKNGEGLVRVKAGKRGVEEEDREKHGTKEGWENIEEIWRAMEHN